jgi:Cft2 family RNA processing exonuclease
MKIINLNPDTDIGATAWFVELEGHRLLLDAGMHPKREGREAMPMFGLVKGGEIDAIAISHCHHDHVGMLPVAVRHFPRAHVLMPELSYFIVERVLHNSVNVMLRQRDELGIKDYPLYTHDEVDRIAPIFQGFRYNRQIEWAAFHKMRAGFESPVLEFFDAGHVLGSAGILVRGKKESLFYTGDVCFHDQTLMRRARFHNIKADVLITETTRGDRTSPPGVTRQTEMRRFAQALKRVQQRKASVLIPTFALGRTQEMLAVLALLMQRGELRRQPIYIGGLGRVFTEIYDLEAHRTWRHHRDLQLREALDLVVLDQNQPDAMKPGGSKIYLVTAGMMTENTPAHDLAVQMAGDPRQAIFFVGYTDPDSPGGKLRAAKRGETFKFSESAGELTLRCEVESFDFSAHAQREDLLEFIGRVSPRVVVLGHGNTAARAWFEDQIRAHYPKMKVIQAQPGEPIEL